MDVKINSVKLGGMNDEMTINKKVTAGPNLFSRI
jgi:hypothetical protein